MTEFFLLTHLPNEATLRCLTQKGKHKQRVIKCLASIAGKKGHTGKMLRKLLLFHWLTRGKENKKELSSSLGEIFR